MRTHNLYTGLNMNKTKSINITDVLSCLVLLGVVSIAMTSPYFLYSLMKILFKSNNYSNVDKSKFRSVFYYAKRKGFIEVKKDGHDIKIFITEKGRAWMKKYKIENLEIKKPKKWDGKFRVIAFDIPNSQKIQRNAFRSKLKELGFYSTQKSVWMHPFNCQDEIRTLMEFLGLTNRHVQIFIAEKVEDDILLKKIKNIYKI